MIKMNMVSVAELDDSGFEFIGRRSNSPLDSRLLSEDLFLKMVCNVVSLKKFERDKKYIMYFVLLPNNSSSFDTAVLPRENDFAKWVHSSPTIKVTHGSLCSKF